MGGVSRVADHQIAAGDFGKERADADDGKDAAPAPKDYGGPLGRKQGTIDTAPGRYFPRTSYAMLTPGASGQCRLDTLTKTKAVQLIQLDYTVGPEERRYAEMIYPAVQDGMKSGLYLPHRASTLCSRRYCGYWRECEREFGGRVQD